MHSMHSVFAESLNLAQVKDSGTQTHNLQGFIAEIYSDLIHWRGMYANLLLCWETRYFITLLRYTQQNYLAEA